MRLLVVLKPDCIAQRKTGLVLNEFEKLGFKFNNLYALKFRRKDAEELYIEHKEKDFFNDLVTFMTTEYCVLCELLINSASDVALARSVVSSIRDEYSLSVRQNILHCSDSIEAGKRECDLFFPETPF